MERLVLGLIAVIGLHVAFVLYMSGIRRVDQNSEIARGGGVRVPTGQAAARPAVVPEVPMPVAPHVSQPPPSRPSSTGRPERERLRPGTLRASATAQPEITYRRHSRTASIARAIPAFPRPGSSIARNVELTFSDRVILYKKPVSPPSFRISNAAPMADIGNRRRKNNSLVAKLQWVYKKPWGLMKAVGSKLR